MLSDSGIPTAFLKARFAKNCDVYAADKDKACAYEMVREMKERGWIEQEGRYKRSILISGPHGTGKTWLATALFKELAWQHAFSEAGRKVSMEAQMAGTQVHFPKMYWREAFLIDEEVRDAYTTNQSSLNVKKKYWQASVLLLDDIGSLERGDETTHRSELLHQTLEFRKNRCLPTILTTNLTGKGLREHYGERSFNRLIEMCALVEMGGKNYRLHRIQ